MTIETFEYGICWVNLPVSDKVTVHQARRNNKGIIDFFIDDKSDKKGHWIKCHKDWKVNFQVNDTNI